MYRSSRCGFTRACAQMRWTVDLLTSSATAIFRHDQWVLPSAGFCIVLRSWSKFSARQERNEQTTLATLWTREPNSWKLISYNVDPVWDEYRAPDTATAAPPGAPEVYAAAPAELIAAGTK